MKSFLKSKAFWLGVLNIVIGILTYISGQLTVGAGITVNGILIIIIRFFTNQAIYLTAPSQGTPPISTT